MEVHFSNNARRFLKNASKPTAVRIIKAIEGLKNNPPSGNIKPYKSLPKFFRLRVGDYRVIFCIEGNIIKITEIDSRGQIY